MSETIAVPTWLFVLLVSVFLLVILNRLVVPSVKWFFRKKVNTAIDELNQRLNVKIRPFQLTKRQVLLDRLIHDSAVLEHVQTQALADEIPREVLMEKVQKYAREIVPSFNAYIYYRVGYWLSKKLAKLLYRVRVGDEKNDRLAALNKHATVVFVMNHRSNMDYILVSFLVAERMALSYAVGEWAKVWPLQSLIKSMGAYFVRRNSRNPLYRKVLERYIDMATREGVCQAVFPEGGLSRDGKIRPPKLGFLDYMLRHYDHTRDRDVVFVPVGINYDRVLEDRTLLLSLDQKAEKKSNWFAVRTTLGFIWNNFKLARKHQWNRFGFASVNFAAPISAKAYCELNQVNFESLPIEKRFEQIEVLAKHLMQAVEKTVPLVPVVLIAKLFADNSALMCNEASIAPKELKNKARDLMSLIESKGGQIIFPHQDKDMMLDAAIDRLLIRGLIEKIGDDRLSVVSQNKQLLDYYANSANCW